MAGDSYRSVEYANEYTKAFARYRIRLGQTYRQERCGALVRAGQAVVHGVVGMGGACASTRSAWLFSLGNSPQTGCCTPS